MSHVAHFYLNRRTVEVAKATKDNRLLKEVYLLEKHVLEKVLLCMKERQDFSRVCLVLVLAEKRCLLREFVGLRRHSVR